MRAPESPSNRGENAKAIPASNAARGPPRPSARASRRAPSQAATISSADQMRWASQSGTSGSRTTYQAPCGKR